MEIDSFALINRGTWDALSSTINERSQDIDDTSKNGNVLSTNRILYGTFWLRVCSTKVNIGPFEEFVSKTKGCYLLRFNKKDLKKMHFKNLRKCVVKIGENDNEYSQYDPKYGRLTMSTALEDLAKTVGLVKTSSQIFELRVEHKVDLEKKKLKLLHKLLKGIHKKRSKLFRIKLNGRLLEGNQVENKKFRNELLKRENNMQKEYFLGKETSTMLSRSRLVLFGDSGVGKTSLWKCLVGENLTAVHETTSVADVSGVLEISRKQWKLLDKKKSHDIQKERLWLSSVGLEEELEENVHLNVWDFGSNNLALPFHPLYMSQGGIYVFVIDLVRFRDNPRKEVKKLRNWCGLYTLFSLENDNNPVFFVGTRASVLSKEEIEGIDEEFSDLSTDLYNYDVQIDPVDDYWFFPVDLSTGQEDIQTLRRSIRQSLYKEKINGVWKSQLSHKVATFFHDYLSLVEENAVSKDEIMSVAFSHDISKGEVERCLHLFNASGDILDFRDMNLDDDPASIIVKPSWLLEGLRLLVLAKVNGEEMNALNGDKDSLDILNKHCIFSASLIKSIFGSKNFSAQEVDLILSLCEVKQIMARLRELPSSIGRTQNLNDNTFWIIPGWIEEEAKLEKYKRRKLTAYIARSFVWYQIVPDRLFEFFLCTLLNSRERSLKVKSIQKNLVRADVLEVAIELRREKRTRYRIYIFSKRRNKVDEVHDFFKRVYKAVFTLFVTPSLEIEQPIEGRRDIFDASTFIEPKSKISYDCFISHSWNSGSDCNQKAKTIANYLRDNGITHCQVEESGSLSNEEIFDLQAKSRFMLILITQDYATQVKDEETLIGQQFDRRIFRSDSKIIPIIIDEQLRYSTDWKGSPVFYLCDMNSSLDFSKAGLQETILPKLMKLIKESKIS